MRTVRLLPILALLASILPGCTVTPNWLYNTKVAPDKQQKFFDADAAYCKSYAEGSVDLPVPIIVSGYRTFGTYTYSNVATGQTYVGHYSSYSGPNINAIGAGLAVYFAATAIKQNNRFNSCISELGWKGIPCKTCIPKEADPIEKLKKQYLSEGGNKALAFAVDGKFIGASWGAKTKADAISLALKSCAAEGKHQCHITNINGTEVSDPSDDLALAKIPEQSPPMAIPAEYRDISIKVEPSDAKIAVTISNKNIPTPQPGHFSVTGNYAEHAPIAYKVNGKKVEQWWQVYIIREGYKDQEIRLDFDKPGPVELNVQLEPIPSRPVPPG